MPELDKMPAMSEKEFLAQVVEIAQTLGWLCYHTYRSTRSTAGFPDLVLVRDGHLTAVELKSERGHLTPDQVQWLDELTRANISVFVWRPAQLHAIAEYLHDPTSPTTLERL